MDNTAEKVWQERELVGNLVNSICKRISFPDQWTTPVSWL
ncbi:hypothetical protein DKAM_0062 [Desulfurococcus amylolyticus 1221n]|uniref:Uncharacterized protein n=1 Tax=Desulfurococcus amylolyticus (strain DSM 18924 / JCM 16383 / VKM B-2413 / 1221n) TaxID=490899 RepID=B8D3C0_DESA1|nr:hypothetical protein DKAM_0062 [Desulfurococcus amylolyticus 1221n]